MSDDVDSSVAALAATLEGRVDELAAQLVTRIVDQIDFYALESVVSREELEESVSDNFSFMLGQLRLATPPDLSAPRRTGRKRAAQRAPLPEVLHAYRLAFEFLWREMLAEARRSGEATVSALLDTATHIWSLTNEYCEELTDTYRAVLSEQDVATDRKRSALVFALLSGVPHDDLTPWEIAQLLHLPYEGRYLVVVAETPLPTEPALPRIESALREVGAASAWYAQLGADVGLVLCGRSAVEDVARVVGLHVNARVGISAAFSRLDQASGARRRAKIAMESVGESVAVRQFESSALSELVIGNLDTTRAVTRQVLGEVLALDDRDVLIETAEAWLNAHGSAADAGRLLYCHENTVRYRLHRLEKHLGRSLGDPRVVAELAVAIESLKAFPDLRGAAVTQGC